jgi:hypothetical protein
MVRFDPTSGTFSFEDAVVTARLLEDEQRARLAAEAEQAALSVVYRVGGKPDPTRPCHGLLTERLNISERTAYELLRTGKLRYTLAAQKCIRISELAVREFLGDAA